MIKQKILIVNITYINATESESEIIFNLQPFNNTKNLKFQYLSLLIKLLLKKITLEKFL